MVAHRSRQLSWWAAALLFLATSVAACLVLAYWVDELLRPLVVYEYLPGQGTSFWAASIAGAIWAVVYALGDVGRPGRAHWYDLFLTWFEVWRRVFRPPGLSTFLRAIMIAIPLNVTVTLLVSLAAASVGYAAGGSESRGQAFRLTFILTTGVAAVFELAHPRRVAEVPETEPPP
jgi:hypothetical protein